MKRISYTLLTCLLLVFVSCEGTAPKKERSKRPRNGVHQTFKDGKLYSEVNYKDGKRHGRARNFYPDGKVHVEYHYVDSIKEGPYQYYYENGKLYQEVNYTNGHMHGLEKKYFKTGQLMSEMPWKEGRPGKGLKEYTKEGKLKKKIPKIEAEEINTAALDGQVLLKFKVNAGQSKVDIYRVELDEDGFLPEDYESYWIGSNEAEIQRFVSRGSFIMQTITVVAKVKTRSRNYYLLPKEYNLVVNN